MTTTLPGLIDIHVHLRDLGQEYKEDFTTGTSAALAGGFTQVFDMPNNTKPIMSATLLDQKINEARKKTVCDIGFYFGSLGNNLEEFSQVAHKAMGLKLYLDMTTGGFIIDQNAVMKIYQSWESTQPIMLHSEEDNVHVITEAVKKTGRTSHFCHVSSKHELSQIIKAKNEGLPVTCGVCPHHLFLTENDTSTLGAYGKMKPYLKSPQDVAFLWDNLRYVDVIESDHAPHTKEEKDSENPPFGVPGLETTLPLLLTAVHDKRLTIDDLTRLCYTNPMKILMLKEQPNTYVEIEHGNFSLSNNTLHTKCQWTPFNNWKVTARVQKVVLRNSVVFENNAIIAQPGSGKIIQP